MKSAGVTMFSRTMRRTDSDTRLRRGRARCCTQGLPSELRWIKGFGTVGTSVVTPVAMPMCRSVTTASILWNYDLLTKQMALVVFFLALHGLRTQRIAMGPRPRGRGPPPPEHMINENIKGTDLRVVTEAEDPSQPDEPLGVMSKQAALQVAADAGLDLVCISPGADPPVCKVIDYGRFKFQLEKKKKLQKKATQTQALKEIKLSYTIETHDFNVRKRAAEKFLTQGNKVLPCQAAGVRRRRSRSPGGACAGEGRYPVPRPGNATHENGCRAPGAPHGATGGVWVSGRSAEAIGQPYGVVLLATENEGRLN